MKIVVPWLVALRVGGMGVRRYLPNSHVGLDERGRGDREVSLGRRRCWWSEGVLGHSFDEGPVSQLQYRNRKLCHSHIAKAQLRLKLEYIGPVLVSSISAGVEATCLM